MNLRNLICVIFIAFSTALSSQELILGDGEVVSRAPELSHGLLQKNQFYRAPAESTVGYLQGNPFMYLDVGYIDNMKADLGDLNRRMSENFLTTIPGPKSIQVYQREREGRAVPLGFVRYNTPWFKAPSVSRIIQKGGTPTLSRGDHKDGLLDLSEAYNLMLMGEIFNSWGLFTTRGLAAAHHKGHSRRFEGGDGGPAGIVLRAAEMPRLQDKLDIQNVANRSLDLSMSVSHPIMRSDLSHVDHMTRNWFLSVVHEAGLKDMWVLHGSYFYSQNRSGSLIDFGTTAPLSEPHSHAGIGFTSWGDEIWGQDRYRGSRFVTLEAKDVTGKTFDPAFDRLYDSTFAFYQLKRIGMSDKQVLQLFQENTIRGQTGEIRYMEARPELIEFARRTVEIDNVQMGAWSEFKADYTDPQAKGYGWRVVVNTRKLYQNMIKIGIYQNPNPSQGELVTLIKNSIFETHGSPDAAWDRLGPESQGKLLGLVAKQHQVFHQQIRISFDADGEAARQRMQYYPTHQHLPRRDEIRKQIEEWIKNPERFGKEFVEYIRKYAPQGGPIRDAWEAHYFKEEGAVSFAEADKQRSDTLQLQFGACGRNDAGAY